MNFLGDAFPVRLKFLAETRDQAYSPSIRSVVFYSSSIEGSLHCFYCIIVSWWWLVRPAVVVHVDRENTPDI